MSNLLFNIVASIFILKNIQFTDILYLHREDSLILIKTLQYLCLIFLLLNIFKNFKILYILNFLIITLLLNLKYGYNVEDLMFQITSFWMIFINVKKLKIFYEFKFWENNNERSRLLFLFGLNILITFFIAGIGKALDPIWMEDLGMYYVLSLPWISFPEFTNIVREHKPVVLILSKIALIFEIIILPLYLFKRTRFISVILLTIFWVILFFPLRLDFIGIIGVISCLYMVSQIKVKYSF